MKNLKLLCIIGLFILALASVNATFSTGNVNLGSESQERGQYISTTITITNPGPFDIHNAAISFPNVNSKYNLTSTLSSTNIAINQSIQVTVTGFVPLSLNAVNADGKVISNNLGSMLISGVNSDSSTTSSSVTVFMQAENKLKFSTESKLIIAGSTKSLRNNKEIDNVQRNDDVQVTVGAENRFSRNGDCPTEGTDCEIQDITARVESTDSDMDVDEDLDFSDMSANRKTTESFSFKVPDDIDDGSYDFEMWMTGTDENGALHGDNWRFTLNVEVPGEEVTIRNYEITPDTIDCTGGHATLSVDLENTGNDDLDTASLIIDSSKLDIKDSIYRISIDSGDQATKTFDLDIPKNLAAGQYFIQVIGNVNNNDETDREAATLNIVSCQTQENNNGNENPKPTQNSTTDVNIIQVPPTSGVIYGVPKNTSFFNSSEFVLVLAGLFIMGFLLLLILIVVLLKR